MLNQDQLQFIQDILDIPLQGLVTAMEEDDLQNILNEIYDCKDKDFSQLNIPNNDNQLNLHLKTLYDFYFQRIQMDNLAKLGRIPDLERWQENIRMHISTAIYHMYAEKYKEKEKAKAGEKLQQAENNNAAIPLFSKYETVGFFDNVEMAMAAIEDPAVAKRFTSTQIFELSKNHRRFAVYVFSKAHLLAHLSKDQVLELANQHEDIASLVLNKNDLFGLNPADLKNAFLSYHYKSLKREGALLSYCIQLVTDSKLSAELSSISK